MAKTRAKTKAEKEPAEPPKAPPKRTPEEQALVDSYKNREWIDRPPRKKLTKRPDGTFNASFEGDVDLEVSKLARAFGVTDWIVGSTLAHQVANANQIMRPGEPELATNVAISLVQGIGPRDTVEAMLAAQMVATHTTAMEMLRRLNLEQKSTDISDSIANRATKLMRTFSASGSIEPPSQCRQASHHGQSYWPTGECERSNCIRMHSGGGRGYHQKRGATACQRRKSTA